jgi:hypothetical protein
VLDTIISSTPLWLLYILTAGFVLLGFQLGWFLGRRPRDTQAEKDAPIGAIVAATFALLAFMLGFTFNMAASRYEARKQFVLQEANAIYTTYLRSEFLAEPQASSIQSILKEYASLHTQGVTALRTPADMAKTAALQQRIWADTLAATKDGGKGTSPVLDSLFVQAVNQLIDTDAARIQAGRNQVPDSIWFVLYLVTFMAMATSGYYFGLSGRRRWAAVALLVLTFSVVIVLIADLDAPQGGFLQVSQQPILDVIDKMNAPAP